MQLGNQRIVCIKDVAEECAWDQQKAWGMIWNILSLTSQTEKKENSKLDSTAPDMSYHSLLHYTFVLIKFLRLTLDADFFYFAYFYFR